MQESSWGVDMTSMSGYSDLWEEMLSGNNGELINPVVIEQYDLVYGSWPTAYDEVVIVLNENNELDDMTLYALGLESYDDIQSVFSDVLNHKNVDTSVKSWSYQEICDQEYRVVLSSDCYSYDESTGTYTDLRDTDTGLSYLYDNGLTLKVTGIIRPNGDSVSSMISGSIAYTGELTKYIIREAENSEAIKAQKADPDTDIFTGLSFKPEDEPSDSEKAEAFKAAVLNMSDEELADAYVKMMGSMSEEDLQMQVDQYMATMTRETMSAAMASAMAEQMGMGEEEIAAYLGQMSDEELEGYFRQLLEQQITEQYAAQVEESLMEMTTAEKAEAFKAASEYFTDEQNTRYYDEILEFSDSTYEDNLTTLGAVDLESPASINLYASSFENKDLIEDAIADYNASVDSLHKIDYTDYVGLIMSSVTTIINVITYVLIAFVAISLIVSSIMIGVITLISVQERTKEIGILRAIGASKKNVSSMFNAETIIIGFTSGVFGVAFTWLICIPINAIIHKLTGIGSINASLPIATAGILVLISMFLTLIAGIIPSRSASKKDPVVALRTE